MSEERRDTSRETRRQRPHPGDIGRRVALRRQELGLTREEAASRAGMAPGYLRYVEEQPGDVDVGGLIRLAGALQTSVDELRGGQVDVPPGQSPPLARPELEELSADECRTRLRDRGVGRVAVPTEAGPAVFPVNYVVAEDDTIVYRTAPDAAPAAAVGRKISFEVDQVDDALSQGWSVLVSGAAEEITEAEAADLLPPGVVPRPWPGGERNLLVRVTPSGVTGRLIRAG